MYFAAEAWNHAKWSISVAEKVSGDQSFATKTKWTITQETEFADEGGWGVLCTWSSTLRFMKDVEILDLLTHEKHQN